MTPLRLGLVGKDIGHSRSPALHAHFLRASGLSGSYCLLPATTDAHALRWFDLLQRGVFAGLNVTTPYKGLAAQWAGHSGTLNTLWTAGDQRCGACTDGAGLLAALNAPVRGRVVVVLGSGGAALACAQALVAAEARVVVSGRNGPATAQVAAQTGAHAAQWGDASAVATASLVVHVCRFGHGQNGPVADAAQWSWLPWSGWRAQGTRVFDAVYCQQGPTWFEQLALGHGLLVDQGGGLQMLAAQAALAFALWTQCQPDGRRALQALFAQ